ncbi:DNA adenine methylase [Salipiger abyssi]|uniref:DNA adenine methylase n=1 Tax=Salipiger abyssi TaxID=1250539 RepID=UPI001A8C61EE|nr:DNA adenine methylase [Salipiger abyssi]MBN9889374.1 DNA adenine methylase [Salipiger abyssi]
MSFRYIGSKARIVEAIIDHIGEPDGGVFVDAFSGTGAVAQAASRAGWRVHVNDHLLSSAIMSYARVLSSADIPFRGLSSYDNAVAALNEVKPIPGFIWREYSPASSDHGAVSRMYFTEENAKKIDGMRRQIRDWRERELVTTQEERVLIADLMRAANRVANTAGTYGCFLSKWQRQSLDTLFVERSSFPNSVPHATMGTQDVHQVSCKPEDTVYLDPPYTKRQYAAYYHILETIALGDEPEVEGVCGIRPWREKASDFCYKVRAAKAIERLVASLPARRIFLSYSTEGHVPITSLSDTLAGIGQLSVHSLQNIGRYRPNRAASEAASDVGELLFCIEKTKEAKRVAA